MPKHIYCLLLTLMVLVGCTTSTVESRKKERLAAYETLPAELKQLVDTGQIKVGMPPDAVYMAWGAPAEVLTSENEQGQTVTWLYYGGWMQETRYWTYREVTRDGTAFLERYLERDYNPRDYIRAELEFVNEKLARWKTRPRPTE